MYETILRGKSRIRTYGWFGPTPVFKTGALNHSAIFPEDFSLSEIIWFSLICGGPVVNPLWNLAEATRSSFLVIEWLVICSPAQYHFVVCFFLFCLCSF